MPESRRLPVSAQQTWPLLQSLALVHAIWMFELQDDGATQVAEKPPVALTQQVVLLSEQRPLGVRGRQVAGPPPPSSPVDASPASLLLGLPEFELERHATATAAARPIELATQRNFTFRIILHFS